MNIPANRTIACFAPRVRSSCVRRLGAWGFWFFFAKGMLWLSAPYVVYALSSLAGNPG